MRMFAFVCLFSTAFSLKPEPLSPSSLFSDSSSDLGFSQGVVCMMILLVISCFAEFAAFSL